MDWNTARYLLSSAININNSSSSSSSSVAVAVVKSILLRGPSGVGKHSLIESVMMQSSSSLSSIEYVNLATVLSNPSRKISDQSAKFPFSSSLFSSSSSSSSSSKTKSTKLIVWEDLHLCVGGFSNYTTDHDFAAQVIESLTKCLKVDFPTTTATSSCNNNNDNFTVVVIALYDDDLGGGKSSLPLQHQIFSRVFDLVIDVATPSSAIKKMISNNSNSINNNENEIDLKSLTLGYEVEMKKRLLTMTTTKNGSTNTSITTIDKSSSSSSNTKTSSPWDKIVGHSDVKKLLQESIIVPPGSSNNTNSFIKKTSSLSSLFAIPPPTLGLLMTGVPGTGKTMLARALAESLSSSTSRNNNNNNNNEINQNNRRDQQQSDEISSSSSSFFSLDASSIVSAEVGVSERRLVEIFEKARRNAPSVIFIDEAQSIFRKSNNSSAHHDSSSSTTTPSDKRLTTTLLRLIDENRSRYMMMPAEQSDNNNSTDNLVIVIAATNVPRLIEPALLRYGRLSKIIHVPPPSLIEVKTMVKKWLKERHGIISLSENDGDDDRKNDHSHHQTVASWFLNEGIVEWTKGGKAESNSNNNKKSQHRQKQQYLPTGADVTGLLNLIDLRLAAAATAAAKKEEKKNKEEVDNDDNHDTNDTNNNTANNNNSESSFLRISPVTEEHKDFFRAVLERVKPSVSREQLKEVEEFSV